MHHSYTSWISSAKKRKRRSRKKGREEGSKEESLVDSAGGAPLVVKWTRFCGHKPRSLLFILSPPHFPARLFLLRNLFHLLLLLLPGHHLSILLVFLASLFRPLVSFPAFRNGRTLLRWSFRGAGHFRPNGPFSRAMGLCKLNERDGRSARSRKRMVAPSLGSSRVWIKEPPPKPAADGYTYRQCANYHRSVNRAC